MRFIAQELERVYVKTWMSVQSDEMVGRTDLLVQTDNVPEPHQGKVDLSCNPEQPIMQEKTRKLPLTRKLYIISNWKRPWMKKFWLRNAANAINKGQKTELCCKCDKHRPYIRNHPWCRDHKKE